jgi:hypothetical protein
MARNRIMLLAALLLLCAFAAAVESGMCRILSVSESEKLILVSQIPAKKKYLLDAASAKIVVDGKAAEFKELKSFSIILVKMELRKSTKNGIDIDGVATEIRISNAEKTK